MAEILPIRRKTRSTHSYLLKVEQQPECICCDYPLTFYQVFLECSDTFSARNLLTNVQCLRGLFTKVHINNILQVFREGDFYSKIKRFLNFSTFYVYLMILCPSDKTFNGAPCLG